MTLCAICTGKVYPRVGGGNTWQRRISRASQGLSPRGRGKLHQKAHLAIPRGSIPAWAGETGTGPAATASGEVYPRVGGGNLPWT